MNEQRRYVAVVGVNWPDGQGGEHRAEPGEDVPAYVVEHAIWLLEQGAVREAPPPVVVLIPRMERP